MGKIKKIVTALIAIIVIGSLGGRLVTADAKEIDYHLCRKNVTVYPKGCATLELTCIESWGETYARGKIEWKVISGKKNIRLQKIKGNDEKIKVIGLKEGTAKVQVTHRKQKLVCTVTVKTNDKIMRVTKADEATAKKIHNRLMSGKAVYIMTNKRSEGEAERIIKKLSKKIGEYNTCGVGIDIGDYTNRFHNRMKGVAEKEKSYYYYKLDVYDAKGYKNAISGVEKWFAEAKRVNDEAYKSRNDLVENRRAELREVYATDSFFYADIFKEVTGISYEDYVSATTKLKLKNVVCYQYEKGGLFSGGGEYTLPGDWYYATYIDKKTNETNYFFEDIVLLYDWVRDTDDVFIARKGDYDNYAVKLADRVLDEENIVRLSEVTFHYEPLTIDLTGVQQKINTNIEDELLLEFGVSDISTYTQKTAFESAIEEANKFSDLSQAQQVYYLIDAYHQYEGSKQRWEIVSICQYLGAECYDSDSFRVTNSKGQTGYLEFNDIGYAYTASGKKKKIENFVN